MNCCSFGKASNSVSILFEENTAGRTTWSVSNKFLPRQDPNVVDQGDSQATHPTVDRDGAVIDVHENVSIIVMNPNQYALSVCIVLEVRKERIQKTEEKGQLMH